jgi:hypothetical protein
MISQQPLLKQPNFLRTREVKYPKCVLSTRHGGDNFLMEIMLQVSVFPSPVEAAKVCEDWRGEVPQHCAQHQAWQGQLPHGDHASGQCGYDIQALQKQVKFTRTGEVKYHNSVLSTRHGGDNFLMEIMLQVSETMISNPC